MTNELPNNTDSNNVGSIKLRQADRWVESGASDQQVKLSTSGQQTELSASDQQVKLSASGQQAELSTPEQQVKLSALEQQAVADAMFDYLKDILYNPHLAHLDVEKLPDAFHDLGDALLYIGQCIVESRTLANDIAKGNLATNPLSSGNELASGLKNLQATLKHLTWQMGQVAKGDYKQHVGFAGDFSESINHMVNQLDERDTALRAEVAINQQKTKELLQSVSLLEAVTENITQWVIVVDRKTKDWLYNNHDPAIILRSLSYIDGLKSWLIAQTDLAGQRAEKQLLKLGYCENEEGIQGGIQYFEVTRYPVTWRDHKAYAFELNDITNDKRARDELETVAYYDALTGAYSRHFGMRVLDKWLENHEPFIIAFIDMDKLKFVNDTYGHSEGDAYIIAVTNSLKHFDGGAILCRLGGDEFMLLSKGASQGDAAARLEKMRSELIAGSDEDYQRSISYGVIEVTEDNDKSSSYLLSCADEIMYAYKRARKIERRVDA